MGIPPFWKKERAERSAPSFRKATIIPSGDEYDLYSLDTLMWLGTFPYEAVARKYAEDNGYVVYF